jgi:hypothetical protein
MVMHNDWRENLNKAAMICFKVLSLTSLGKDEERHEMSESRQLVTR